MQPESWTPSPQLKHELDGLDALFHISEITEAEVERLREVIQEEIARLGKWPERELELIEFRASGSEGDYEARIGALDVGWLSSADADTLYLELPWYLRRPTPEFPQGTLSTRALIGDGGLPAARAVILDRLVSLFFPNSSSLDRARRAGLGELSSP